MEATKIWWGCIRIMEMKIETTIVYWGCIGIMDKKMEDSLAYRCNGKENGNYYNILEL